jgi:hypothetical protein
MNLTKEQCDEWKKEPGKNPITKRKIAQDGAVYKKIEKICHKLEHTGSIDNKRPIGKKDCDTWKKDPSHHPITKRKLNMTAKGGIYAQLMKLCSSPTLPRGRPTIAPKSPIVDDDLEKKREKLIAAVKKAVAPILHKGDTTRTRVQFSKIMNEYLNSLKPCLTENAGKLVLETKKKEPVVLFEKRIGSESVYGVAYMNMGKGLAKMLKFSCKIMASNVKGHKQEIDLLMKMSKFVEKGQCPNMPITYRSIKCNKSCDLSKCPNNIKKNGYYVVINELANSDIQTWFQKTYDDATYESVIMQLMFSMYCFHNLGYQHNDCHLGNFLIHQITPGGYWRYKIGDVDVYVPNKGYLVVMWDPGLASKLEDMVVDYYRCFMLISNMHKYKSYMDKGMKTLPKHLVDYGVVPLLNTFNYSYKTEKETVKDVLNHIKNNVIKFKHIHVGGSPPDYLLNVTPYKCESI